MLEIGARADDFHEGLRMKGCKNPHKGLRDALLCPTHTLFYPRQIWARFWHFDFFSRVEKNPLTIGQRQAVILDEGRSLVIAGAGTGKTSTVIGKIVYLVGIKKVKPEDILVITYNKANAQELRNRVKNLEKCMRSNRDATTRELERMFPVLRRNLPSGVNAVAQRVIRKVRERQSSRSAKWGADARRVEISTFHALGKKIMNGPDVDTRVEEENLPKFLGGILEECLKDKKMRGLYTRYFERYEFPKKDEHRDFKSLREYSAWVRTSGNLQTLNGETVKSYGELMIANFLFMHNVTYEYERPYSPNSSMVLNRPYQPDFYIPKIGAHKIGAYIEYFGVDEKGNTAPYIDAKEYRRQMRWKKKTHKEGNTDLIELFYHQNKSGCLLAVLEKELVKRGVTLKPKRDSEVLEKINQTGKHEKFVELLLIRFLSQFKENPDRAPMNFLYREARGNMRTTLFLEIFEIVYQKYREKLVRAKTIDFGDMISKATALVEQGGYVSNWKYVIIDEFQDISDGRYALVQALLEKKEGAKLFCVGDDWQAINRFAGSNPLIINNFKDRYERTTSLILDRTFRFNNKIAETSGKFVMRNSSQIKKEIIAPVWKDDPQVFLHWTEEDQFDAVLKVVRFIREKRDTSSKSLQILFRYNRSKDRLSPPLIRRLEAEWEGVVCQPRTIHGAKGLEADYVIVADLDSEKSGFPNIREDDPILNLVLPPLPSSDDFRHSEERRVFYVALTRAREQTHLIANSGFPSEFAEELGEHEDYYKVAVAGDISNHGECPACEDGMTVRKKNESDGSTFFGCVNYSICDYTVNACFVCHKAPIKRMKRKRHASCINERCGTKYNKCNNPKCSHGVLIAKRGAFFGCHTYNGKKYGETNCPGRAKKLKCPSCSKGEIAVREFVNRLLVECSNCSYGYERRLTRRS
ncbi:MAG: UvrD-helicase domain-containing protein [Alphaproteobacteria bacterium]|nr:UvrD-helicase domain-containing protein [Alphaproteobacteria bacterium]MDA8004525.1 UvrD-helicase domain-containing protein [Alphaproteobacteria bacterium]MDA8005403.1 UvrD-helicase domain-containing protein [Alphaproteobacteria bacterium]MDA8012904.1 UvrD-helicase domain-containing protein [Alphaproteobacteria bacterium]